MDKPHQYRSNSILLVICLVLAFISFKNFLLFHNLIELYSIIISFVIFILAINTRHISKNSYLLFIGVAYGFIGFFDLFHTLSYKGMGIFSARTADLPTQLWIIARYLEAISLLIVYKFINTEFSIKKLFFSYFIISVVLLSGVFGLRWFPTCYQVGTGLTTFKVYSEYLIIAILIFNMLLLIKKRNKLHSQLYKYMLYSIGFTISSELFFTLYFDVYGSFNMLGHITKLISFYYIYKSMIQINLLDPYNSLFVNIRKKNKKIKRSNNILLVITKVKGLIATEEDIETLLDKSLDVLLEKKDYIMAWVGKVSKEDQKLIPIAYSGISEGKLKDYIQDGDAPPRENRLIEKVIEERREIIEKNRDDFKNYSAIIALPIINDGKIYGVLNIYSNSKNAFIEEEINLLQDLVANIGFAISKIQNKERIKYLSFHDKLTGLYNRMFFNKELERLDVKRNLPLSIVVTDLNGLKSVNDNYGHKMGDKLIIAFADLLKEHCRRDDIICRWGGDEFALLFPNTSASKTEEIISRINEQVKETSRDGVQLSSAFGYAVKNNSEEDIEQIFKRADNNMYQHKAQQKKRD